MKCPVDSNDLIPTVRDGIEIDYCPKCRGVWLDRGELDKLIERAMQHEMRYTGGRGGYAEGPELELDGGFDVFDADKRKRDYAPPPAPAYRDERREYRDDYRRDDDDDRYERERYHDPRKKRKSLLGDIFDIFD